jgi:hypothetical protein
LNLPSTLASALHTALLKLCPCGGAPTATRLHERSRFVCQDGQWLYVTAVNI